MKKIKGLGDTFILSFFFFFFTVSTRDCAADNLNKINV